MPQDGKVKVFVASFSIPNLLGSALPIRKVIDSKPTDLPIFLTTKGACCSNCILQPMMQGALPHISAPDTHSELQGALNESVQGRGSGSTMVKTTV